MYVRNSRLELIIVGITLFFGFLTLRELISHTHGWHCRVSGPVSPEEMMINMHKGATDNKLIKCDCTNRSNASKVEDTIEIFSPSNDVISYSDPSDTPQDSHPSTESRKSFQGTSEVTAPTDVSSRDKLWDEVVLLLANQTQTKKLPGVIGIGVMKCGTHALIQFLQPHPLIRISTPSDTEFFLGYGTGLNRAKYIEMMPLSEESAISMERTPAYFSFHKPEMPFQIKTIAPTAKIILQLCNPTTRALSDFVQNYGRHQDTKKIPQIEKFKTFDHYVAAYLPRVRAAVGAWDDDAVLGKYDAVLNLQRRDVLYTIITVGLYALHIGRWLELYERSTQMMIVDADEMFHDPGQVIENVQQFLGLPTLLMRSDYVKDSPESKFFCYRDWRRGGRLEPLPANKRRTRDGKMTMSNVTRKQLDDFYHSYNEALFKKLQTRLTWGRT